MRAGGLVFELREDLFWVGEAAGFRLRVDRASVDDYVEHAAAAANQLGLDADFLLDRGRQTGGLREVVSGAAVRDGDVHRQIVPQSEARAKALPSDVCRR